MVAYLWPRVSCRLYKAIIRQIKKILEKWKKSKKYSQKNIYVRIMYKSFFFRIKYNSEDTPLHINCSGDGWM